MKTKKIVIPGKTLVVCPASLIGQWEGEIKKRLEPGTISVLIHHGPTRDKVVRRLPSADLVISSYNIVCQDSREQERLLFQIRWERVILDEAHHIRNHKTKTAKAMFKLKAKSRWALTGTPVQNSTNDLFSQIKFLRCFPFNHWEVWKKWFNKDEASGKERLTSITKLLMLRRTKAALQDKGELKLADKKVHLIYITQDQEEKEVYEKLLNFSKTFLAKYLHQQEEKQGAYEGVPGTSKSTHNFKVAEKPFGNHPELRGLNKQIKCHEILLALLRLRQFCCHPALIKAMLSKEDAASGGIADIDDEAINVIDNMRRLSLNFEEPESQEGASMPLLLHDNPIFSEDRLSSKLRKVIETLENILKTNEKMVVVSQWVSLLSIVQKVLQKRKVTHFMFTGALAVKDHAKMVDRFNRKDDGPKVMLLTLTAGGFGLNLIGGNHLLLLDLHWNPQLENQACDRIHRIGQEKTVQIYKFISSGTIEEDILKLQKRKLQLADDIFSGTYQAKNRPSLNDLKSIFNM